MAESDNIKEVVNQAAVQAAMAVMMALRYARQDHSQPLQCGIKSQRQAEWPVNEKLAFNCSTQERYTEFINFEMEVFNILETKVHELSKEEKASVIKKID